MIAPVDGTQLTANTMFSWNGEQDTYVWHAESNSWYEGMYVVTTRKTITMPTFPNGFTFRAGDDGYWRVETHGDAETVDDLAGPDGFVDSFGPYADEPDGPRRDAGSFAISAGRGIVAP